MWLWARLPSATPRLPATWSKSTGPNEWQSRLMSVMVRPSAAAGSRPRPGQDALDAIALLADRGVTTFEVTAIDRDGLLQGPDLDLFGRAVALGRGRIIASAGITSRKDVALVRAIGCAGVIIGRALYEGQLSLQDALSAAESG